MTPKGHAIPSKTQLLSYGTPAFARGCLFVGGLLVQGRLIHHGDRQELTRAA